MPTLSGAIERIVFRNDETHFTVARLRPNDNGRLFRSDLVTLVGALPGVRENPYALEKDVYGVGFKTADTLAGKLGTPRDSLGRLAAGLKHVLSEAASADGHCYLPRDELMTRAAALLEVAPNLLAPALEELRREKEVFVERVGGDGEGAPPRRRGPAVRTPPARPPPPV